MVSETLNKSTTQLMQEYNELHRDYGEALSLEKKNRIEREIGNYAFELCCRMDEHITTPIIGYIDYKDGNIMPFGMTIMDKYQQDYKQKLLGEADEKHGNNASN